MAINLRELQDKKLSVLGSKAKINKDSRVLVVGLGGTGTDALIRTKDAMYRRFDLTESEGKIPGNVAFLGIDTDRSVLHNFMGKAFIDPEREFVHLEDPNINIKFAKKEKLLPNYVRDWMNPSLPAPDSLGTGAGGVRQIGRYLLVDGYTKIVKKITDSIRDILKHPTAVNTLHVVVFSGISGGTGSGTFLDMGYLIQKAASDLKIAPTTYLTAYLFLPDVNLANPNVPSAAHNYIKCNGYAALKDLDYLMAMKDKAMDNPDHELVRFRQVYGTGVEDVIDTTEAPFNSVYLISDVNTPQHPIANGYEYALNIVSESVVNFVSLSSAATEDQGAHLSLSAVDVNGASMAAGVKAVTPEGAPIMGNYCYKAIGAATAELPVEDVANYIAKKFFDKMNVLLEKYPTSEEMTDFMKSTKVEASNAMGAIRGTLKGAPGVEQIQPKYFKTDPGQCKILDNILTRYRLTAHNAIDSNVPVLMEQLKSSIRQQIDIVFQDIKKGPFYANRLLTGYKGVPGCSDLTGMIDRIRGILTDLTKKRDAAKQEKERRSQEARKEYIRGTEARFYSTEHFKNYVNEMTAACMKEVEEYTYDRLHYGYSTSILDFVLGLNTDIFNIYVQVLETLKANFDAANVKVSGVETRTMVGREYRWQLVEIESIKSDLDTMFDSADIDGILTTFLTDMIRESQVWLNSGDKIIRKIENFICSQFSSILGKSMDAILGSDFLQNQMDQEIANLAMNAEVHFPADTLVSFPAGGHDIWNSVSVPYNSPQILGQISAYIKNKGLLITPTHSNLTDRILWMKVNIGIPVFLYLYLKDYENAYENAGGLNQGMHLYETKERDWRELPSLVPEELWESSQGIASHTNKRVKALHDHGRAVFAKAVDLHVAAQDSSTFYCCFTPKGAVDQAIDRILSDYKIDRREVACADTGGPGLNSCSESLKELRRKLSSLEAQTVSGLNGYTYQFYKIKQGESGEFIRKSAESAFIAMPELVKRVENELEARSVLDGVIDEIDQALTEVDREKESYEYFINGLATGCIRITGAYVYVQGIEDSLCSLAGEAYPEYRIYTEYSKLNHVVMKAYRELVEQAVGTLHEDVASMRTLAGKYETRIEKLNKGILFKLNRTQAAPREIKVFYNRMNMFLQMLKDDIDMLLELQEE